MHDHYSNCNCVLFQLQQHICKLNKQIATKLQRCISVMVIHAMEVRITYCFWMVNCKVNCNSRSKTWSNKYHWPFYVRFPELSPVSDTKRSFWNHDQQFESSSNTRKVTFPPKVVRDNHKYTIRKVLLPGTNGCAWMLHHNLEAFLISNKKNQSKRKMSRLNSQKFK